MHNNHDGDHHKKLVLLDYHNIAFVVPYDNQPTSC